MRRRDGPDGQGSKNSVDPLDEALRQIGSEVLDEPVPERLREVLRRGRGESATEPDPRGHERSQRTGRR